ncbi:MAG: DUF928 domain-containing protein [Spirulina sp. SIO3F2]|nr:DUF928 domain-containing protein [Spirulina sp. SIO3F2]
MPLIWGGLVAPVVAQNATTKDDVPPLGAPDRTVSGGDRGMCGDTNGGPTVLTALVPADQVIEIPMQTPVLYVRIPQVENAQFAVDLADFHLDVEDPTVFRSIPLTTHEPDALVRLVLPDSIQLSETKSSDRYRYLWTVSLVCSEFQADETGSLAVGGYLAPVAPDSAIADSWLMQLEAAFTARETQPEQWTNWLTAEGYGDLMDLPVRTITLEAVAQDAPATHGASDATN